MLTNIDILMLALPTGLLAFCIFTMIWQATRYCRYTVHCNHRTSATLVNYSNCVINDKLQTCLIYTYQHLNAGATEFRRIAKPVNKPSEWPKQNDQFEVFYDPDEPRYVFFEHELPTMKELVACAVGAIFAIMVLIITYIVTCQKGAI